MSDRDPKDAADPRLAVLDQQIAATRASHAAQEGRHKAELAAATERSFAFSKGFRMSFEIVGGVLLGAALGLALDWFFGTSPWALLGFGLLGFAGGVANLVRQAKQ